MWRKIRYNLAKLFNFPGTTTDPRLYNLHQEIERRGGHLIFNIQKHEDGWVAECVNLPGIITGGKNANPQEINENIKDAIFTAFRIPPHLCNDKVLAGEYELKEQYA